MSFGDGPGAVGQLDHQFSLPHGPPRRERLAHHDQAHRRRHSLHLPSDEGRFERALHGEIAVVQHHRVLPVAVLRRRAFEVAIG